MRELYEHEGIPFDRKVASDALSGLLQTPSLGDVQLMLEDEEIVGYFVLTFGYSLEFRGRFLFLDQMYIRDDYRGRGLGREALEAVEKICPWR